MKKNNLFFSLSMALAASMILPSPIQAAKAPKLSKKSVSLCIGDSTKLQMKNTKKSVAWKSNNKKIASVTKKGKIKAKKSGSTKIVAKIGKKKYNCKVTVKKQKINKTSIDLLVGENTKLKASGISKKADINWVSTDNDVATVYDGEVVAIGEGTATIKAVIPEVFGKTLKCKVTVTKNEENEPNPDNSVENNKPNNNTQKPIDNNTNTDQNKDENKNNSSSTYPPHISISGGNTNSGSNSSGNGSSTTVVTNTNAISIVEREVIPFGSTKSYDISMSGTNDIGTITWSSSNEKVLTVDQNGKAYGRCVGAATLKATTSKGLTASINVDIEKIEGNTYIEVGKKRDIKKDFTNIDIDNPQWKSENEEIASINKNGIVTGLKEGTVKIIGTVDNIVCVELVLNVDDYSYINIDNPGTLTVGETKILSTDSEYIPENAIITWESSNPSVLSVNDKGEVTALSVGEATISVSVNGKVMDSTTISVEADPSEEVEAELIYNSQKTVVVGCSNKEKATKITIPDGVTTIGVNAFQLMHVKTVTMADSVTEISDRAFSNCGSLTNITLSKNIKHIGKNAFMGSGIENIILPDSLEELGRACFYGCESLKSITIPDKMTNIILECFGDCYNLENVILSKNVTKIEGYAFGGCTKLKNIDISNVTYIGGSAFAGCKFEKIVIPDSITSTVYIDEYGNEQIETNIENAFSGCSNLKEVILSKNMEYIPGGIFENCSVLTEIILPESTKKIGEEAFYSCASLEKVTIPETVTSIDDTAFHYCYSLSTIRGKTGSYAETWAKEKGYTFEAITE